ncbi:MAG: pilus assembly protein TadG-related protein [Cohaesibacter sp.]|jgi:Flp pilus assembly protein TadG|nr:pilus assembly protein TadG-related protein [Cohaesibacter sp.]
MQNLKAYVTQVGRAIGTRTNAIGIPFNRDESGSVALIFALSLLPLLMLAGAAVDYSRLSSDRAQVQDALDAAALAVVNKVPTMTDGEIRSMVEAYVKANIPSAANARVRLVTVERNPSKVKIWAEGTTDMSVMKMFNFDSFDYEAKSKAVSSDKAIEVAMVLDNSGSMGGSRLRGLKEAATGLVNVLEANQQSSEDLRIALVPFNHLVRVDKGYKDATWLDQHAKSALHRNNQSPNGHRRLPKNSNRFELFETLKNTEWEGCVEARKHPYDVNDNPPVSKFKNSYYLPYFFPDDRDGRRYSYISDTLSGSASYNPNKDRYGKYYQKTPSYYGPNYGCYIQKITPLTKNMNTVRADINKMRAGGWTNIHMGTIWGLRALSPQAPLTEGAPYSDKQTIKFLIVMSDGANTYSGYGAYGYTEDGRISGSGSTTGQMNSRTLKACKAAKNAGVQVYTIAYGNLGSKTTKMLRKCATFEENAFTPKSTKDMIDVFKKIAAALNNVRLTE